MEDIRWTGCSYGDEGGEQVEGMPEILSRGLGGRESFTELNSRAGKVGCSSEEKKDCPLLEQETGSRRAGEPG